MKKILISFGIITIVIFAFIWLNLSAKSPRIPNTFQKQNVSPSSSNAIDQITTIAENLDTPWALVFLPDNSMLITERLGRVRLIDRNGNLRPEPVAIFDNVKEIGEGGLLGIAAHPNFSTNNYIYLYYTYGENNGNTLNRVVRMTYQNNQLKNEQIIVDNIPGASNHNGGRLKFGPDNYLYITTGDAENPSQAQDTNTLGGKILRVNDEGKSVSDNPFSNLVYSYGHRNPQGLAWDDKGQLWATEHGRSGVQSGFDEVNLIEKGKNYGWPEIQGDETKTGMETPKFNSGSDTWAPAGVTFINNSLIFGGLRGETLYEMKINRAKITLKEHFKGRFGRIRDVVLGPDNFLYITTSNKDGRGNPTVSDDKIIKVNLSILL